MAEKNEDRSKRDRKIEERRNRLRQSAADRKSGLSKAPTKSQRAASAVRGFIERIDEDPEEAAMRRRQARRGKKPKYDYRKIFRLAAVLVVLIVVCICSYRVYDYASSGTNVRLTDKGFTHADRFSDCVVINGIDISEHQGTEINWRKVKTSGADFAFIRAGYRSADDGSLHIDDAFETNVKKAAKAGVMTGAYFYSQATTEAEALEEADFLLELVDPYEITMPLVIDYEIYPDGRLDKKIQAGELYAASLYHDIVLAFCRRVEEDGYESAVYANLDMYTNYMDASILDDEATLWLARYNETADLKANYSFWQCNQEAKVGGIKGKVDQDFWYIEPNKVYKTRGAGIKDSNRISIGNCHVSFQRSVTKIKRRRAIPKLGITYEGKGMKEGRDYVISYVRNTEPGKGYIIIRGIGKYKNWMMIPFKTE